MKFCLLFREATKEWIQKVSLVDAKSWLEMLIWYRIVVRHHLGPILNINASNKEKIFIYCYRKFILG